MPILGVNPSLIDERADFFEYVAGKLLSYPSFSSLSIKLDPLAIRVAVEAYFFMNVAYKAARIPAGSRTRPAKVAAMTALAVGYVKPIRPLELNVSSEEYLFVNGAYALKLACGLQRQPFSARPFDDRLRWYRMVQDLRFPSLQPLIDEANANANHLVKIFEPSLDDEELAKIDTVVEAFCLMKKALADPGE